VLSRPAGRLSDRIGARIPLTLGPLVATAGLVLLALAGGRPDYWTGFFPATLVLGVGMTITVAPLTNLAMSSVGDERAGTASGVNIAVARVAGLVAVTVLSLAFAGRFDRALADRLGAGGTEGRPVAGSALAVEPAAATGALREAELGGLNQAYVAVMMISAAAVAAGGAASAILIQGRSGRSMTSRRRHKRA
jgi:MFS family permease